MKLAKSLWLLLLPGMTLALLVVGGIVSAPRAQIASQPQKEYEHLIYSVKGADLFKAHCAPCHGLDGKGDGPVAKDLKTKPANLTLLARKNGGAFPSEQVMKMIAGNEGDVSSHGSREMPIWGPIFHQIEEDRDYGNVRLSNLVKYLESIQVK